MKTATALLTAALLSSCSIPLPNGATGTATPGWYKPSSQFDADAEFGVFIHAQPAIVDDK